MKIGIIGAGRMGQALAGLLLAGGHDVVLANSRGPASLADLAHELGPQCSTAEVPELVGSSDLVIVATPWGETEAALSVVSDWSGVVVVDTTNNRSKPGPDGIIDIGGRISSEVVAGYVPGARVVKAFNISPIPFMVKALSSGEPAAIYLAGDDAEAKALVGQLVRSIDAEPVDTGDLHTGGFLQDACGPLATTLEMLTPDYARTRLEQARASIPR